MTKTFNFKKYGKNHPLSIQIGHYNNGGLAIRAYTNEAGYPEPWSNITVNLDLDIPIEKFVAFINVNNDNDSMIDALIENGFGELTGRGCKTPYVIYPEFRFYPEKLKEFDEENFEEYDAYADALELIEARFIEE